MVGGHSFLRTLLQKRMGLFDFLFNKKNNIQPSVDKKILLNEAEKKVKAPSGNMVSAAFAQHWNLIEKTALPCISIKATPSEDLALEQSKFGHYPYMPNHFPYPVDEHGKYMYPLAQINCSELPPLHGYPPSGYLQFFISVSDDVYGMDFENNQSQKNFKVLYFEEAQITTYKADFSFLDEVMSTDYLPVFKPHALQFELSADYVGIGDVRYEEGNGFKIDSICNMYPGMAEDLESEAYIDFSPSGHKIGGYAMFTQEDPRIGESRIKDYIVLLQIDSDDQIMWGDCGVANFFIHPDDLVKKDFSKVAYNWDCS